MIQVMPQQRYYIIKQNITKKGEKRDKEKHWSTYMKISLYKNEEKISKDELKKIILYFGLKIIPLELLRIIIGYANFPLQRMICLESKEIGSKKENSKQQLLFTDNIEVSTVFFKSYCENKIF